MERELIEELQALPEPELPPNFHDNLMAGVRKHVNQTRKKRRQTYTRMVIGLAASVVWAVIWVSAGFMLEPQQPELMVAPVPAAMPFAQAYGANIYELEAFGWAEADEALPDDDIFWRRASDAISESDESAMAGGSDYGIEEIFLDIEPFDDFVDFAFLFVQESTLTPAATGGRAWLFAIIGGIGPLLACLIVVIISIKKRTPTQKE